MTSWGRRLAGGVERQDSAPPSAITTYPKGVTYPVLPVEPDEQLTPVPACIA